MKVEYQNDEALRECAFLRWRIYVPVQDAFDILAGSMVQHERMDELLSFFKHTYVRGRSLRRRGQVHSPAVFILELWNQHESVLNDIARTTK